VLQHLISVCLVTAVTLLELFCVIKARENTSKVSDTPSPPPGPGSPPVPYNSSASAVAGVWLVILIFLVSFVRSARPQFMAPCVNFTVVVVVTSSIAPTLPTMPVAMNFAATLLTINVIGLSVWSVVGLLAWPDTNRAAFERSARELVGHMDRCLAVRATTLRKMSGGSAGHGAGQVTQDEDDDQGGLKATDDATTAAAALLATYSRLQANLPYLGDEVSMGHLRPETLLRIHDLLLEVLKPVVGLMASMDNAAMLRLDQAGEEHRQLLVSATDQAIKANGHLHDALHTALELLGLERGPVRHVELGEGRPQANSRRSTHFKSGMQLAQATQEVQRQDWQKVLQDSRGALSGDSKQMLFYLMIQVS
jgi:hypothetical protein